MKYRILVLSLLLASLTFCSSPKDEIVEILDRREKALEQGDLSLYLSCISQNYQDEEKDFAAIRQKVAGSIGSLPGVELSFSDRSIYFEGELATVYQKVILRVDVGGKKKSFSDRERLTLAREEGGWKIIKGL